MGEETEVRNEVHLSVENQEPQAVFKVQIALKTKEKDVDSLLEECRSLYEFAIKSTKAIPKKVKPLD